MHLDINDGVFEQIGRSSEMNAALMDIAGAAAEVARATAPVDTAAYQNGIKAELRQGRGRNVGRVESTDGKTMLIEAQTGNLYRALRTVS